MGPSLHRRPREIDPLENLGVVPDTPRAYWGWGDIPDQYRRRLEGDAADDDNPGPDPRLEDLPPLLHGWGRPVPRLSTF